MYTFRATATASSGGGSERLAPPPANFRNVLASYQSGPIMQDIKVINKVSQNLHAEMLLRLLGRERGSGGTVAGGLEVIRRWLLQADIRPEEYSLHDGSGLSRENLATPHAIVKLLSYVSRQPWGEVYADTLPVGGIDGSLIYRFQTPPLSAACGARRAPSPTSTPSPVISHQRGDRVAFSIMVNNHLLGLHKALETMDTIVELFVEGQR